MDSIVPAMNQAFAHNRSESLAEIFVDDVIIRPPTYGGSWQGKELVTRLVGHAAACFTDFHYTDTVAKNDAIILRFDTKLDGHSMTGIDLVRLNAQQQITEIEIFSRPPKAAKRMLEMMTDRIKNDPKAAALMKS